MNNKHRQVIEYQDELIGELIQEKEKLKRIVNTLLVVTLLLIGVCLILILNP